MKNTCKMLMALGIGSREIYEEDFEKPLLKESREFYRVSGVFLFTVSSSLCCVHSCRLKVRSFLRTTVHLCTSERYNVF